MTNDNEEGDTLTPVWAATPAVASSTLHTRLRRLDSKEPAVHDAAERGAAPFLLPLRRGAGSPSRLVRIR